MAVGDEGAHGELFGQGEGLTVMVFGDHGIESVGMGRDVAEEVQRVGRKAALSRKGCGNAVDEATRLVEPAEQQTGATQREAGPGAMADEPPCLLPLDELLAFRETVERLACLAELRQEPGGGGDPEG